MVNGMNSFPLSIGRRRLFGAFVLATVASTGVGCDKNVLVDDANQNPGILGPRGIIRGTMNYLGPGPCLKDGQVEGVAVVLLFAFNNPPPPDGLASTALNFATVPGEKLFYNYPRPTSGPGSKGHKDSLCPAPDSPVVSASAPFSIQQIGTVAALPDGSSVILGGSFQVRGFYSRQGRFNALFGYANLPLAGDVAGGAIADIRAASPKFAQVDVGVPYQGPDVPNVVKKGDLVIPAEGFIRDAVAVTYGLTLPSSRPFFSVDYANSKSITYTDPGVDFRADYPCDADATGPCRYGTPKAATDTNGTITFRQDHASTSQSKLLCFANKDPACDGFQFAQASFPQIRFRYGFPGNLAEAKQTDAWLAKNAKPASAVAADKATRPYYNVDPTEFGGAFPASAKFMLTRQFNAATGKGEIIRDNDTLESVAQIAQIYPNVVLSKLVEDDNGEIALPTRSQTDPAVVIQTISIRDTPGTTVGSMKATSESTIIGGGLTTADNTAVDPNQPLAKANGFELQEGFTALIRPSTVCIHTKRDLRGTLVTPVRYDPNPRNDLPIVSAAKLLANNPNRVKKVEFGCLPPGHYSINVVYPTGQAWSFPNLMGYCSHTARFQPNEECMGWVSEGTQKTPFPKPGDAVPAAGFTLRPLLASQSPWQVGADGLFKLFDDTGTPGVPPSNRTKLKLPQTIVITPSARCGSYKKEDTVCTSDAGCKVYGRSNVKGSCVAYTGSVGAFAGKSYCDLNGDGRVNPAISTWVSNDVNEDTIVPETIKDKDGKDIINPAFSNGLFSDAKDVNKNGKLDLNTPPVCSLGADAYESWQVAPK